MSTPATQTEAFDRRFLAFLAILVIVLVMIYLFAVTFLPMSTTGGKYADIAVPMLLATGFGGLVGYFFGASKNPSPSTDKPPTPQVLPVVVPAPVADGSVSGEEQKS
jgi:membrane protease YdiL (CAAX protease family)